MVSKEQLIEVVKRVCGKEEVEAESAFETLGMDSTNIVEVLIELEMVLDMDILDANVNLYEMVTVADMYNYLASLTSAAEG
ncbi:acyl carrier protein [Xylanibacillus composti]|uniref:Carrier domain-containing protein n=1 Tax=Xylanibacillus composti TaxID=1572762 RepID=A0A8J4H472_9BACL|nr:phosphopantetheine-binding protein [Xylanibacillus composti]MDT9726743.1 acyl carrier protein [Xylanibacillus composti]GIQ69325.1 hypothetical protein XYCOK13_21490 [Xylanibacillus composti]